MSFDREIDKPAQAGLVVGAEGFSPAVLDSFVRTAPQESTAGL